MSTALRHRQGLPPSRGERRDRADCLRAAILAVALGSVPIGAAAWEPDVHYGLTKWLALQAGFAEHQAEMIAQGDEGVDDSWITGPVHGTMVSACVGADAAGAAAMHDNHFASKRDAPAAPGARAVTAAQVWREGELRSPPKPDGTDAMLLSLGRYLHALQDSWSHQGVPDVPTPCKPQYAWGHALARGGWTCHLADLTYRWSTTDVPAMAQATYEVLAKAAHKKALQLSRRQDMRIATFGAARTKWDKDAWFKEEKFSDRGFLQGVSLPDCAADAKSCAPYPYQKLLERWAKLRASGGVTMNEVPKEIAVLFDQFFTGLLEQNGAITQKELVDFPMAQIALARALHVEGNCPQLFNALSDSMLGPGFGSGRGAQQPLALCELAAEFSKRAGQSISCADAVDAASKAISQSEARGPGLSAVAMKTGRSQSVSYAVTRDPASETYFATARFAHLPRDVLLVGAQKVRDKAKVISVVWLPAE